MMPGAFARNSPKPAPRRSPDYTQSAGKLFLCTANPGKVFSVGPEYEPEGTYESRSFDAQLFSQWGRWIGGVLHLRLLKSWRPSHRPIGCRLSNFLCAPATEDPAKNGLLFGPYAKPGTNAVPSGSLRAMEGRDS